MATAKHFGAYGAAIGGRDYNSADISERTLQEVYLPPFYAAARAGAGSFMVAFNDIAGVPTTSNSDLLRGTAARTLGLAGAHGQRLGRDRRAPQSRRRGGSRGGRRARARRVGGHGHGGRRVRRRPEGRGREGSRAPQTTRRGGAAHPAREGAARPVRQADAVPRHRTRGARAARARASRGRARHRAPVDRAAQERRQAAAAESGEAAQHRRDRRAGHRRPLGARLVARAGQGRGSRHHPRRASRPRRRRR